MEHQTLGDYVLIKELGKGSLGTTYIAEHRFIKKQFVLKILPPELASDQNFTRRFEQEISLYATLNHPHIARIHNVSQSDGIYYLISDCVLDCYEQSTNLAQYLSVNKQSLNENEILEILTQIASALSFAHKQSQGNGEFLAHRGLKLNNILMGVGPRGLHVYLTDFGLTRIVGEGAVLTRTYQVMAEQLALHNVSKALADMDKGHYFAGEFSATKLSKLHATFVQNYAFLAPEQKIYREKPVGYQADVYAFGVLAYFLIMHSFPEGFFPLPSKMYPDLRLNWDLLIYQCLQPDPTKRPLSLAQLVDDLVSPKSFNPHMDAMVKEWNQPAKVSGMQNISPPKEPLSQQMAAPPHPERHNAPQAESTPFQASSYTQPMYRNFEQPPIPDNHPYVRKMNPEANAASSTTALQEEKTHENQQLDMLHQVSDMVKSSQPQPIIKPQEVERPTYEADPTVAFQTDTTVSTYKPKEKEVKEIEPIQTEMVIINGGEFHRGSIEGTRDERPVHKIFLKDFAIDTHAVTNEQFVRFLEVMGGEKDSNNQDIIKLKEAKIKKNEGKFFIESGYTKHPVIGVTWYGAVAYAKWVGKRLPTEAEWEIAARGGMSDALYPTGQTIDRSQANFFSSDTTPVRSYPPNGYGLYDMAGNVYEWCQDWYDYDYYEQSQQEPDNPKGPYQGVYRVLRGGCWKSLKDDLRCAHRHRNNPGTVNSTYGFRCATDVS